MATKRRKRKFSSVTCVHGPSWASLKKCNCGVGEYQKINAHRPMTAIISIITMPSNHRTIITTPQPSCASRDPPTSHLHSAQMGNDALHGLIFSHNIILVVMLHFHQLYRSSSQMMHFTCPSHVEMQYPWGRSWSLSGGLIHQMPRISSLPGVAWTLPSTCRINPHVLACHDYQPRYQHLYTLGDYPRDYPHSLP